MCNNFNNSSTCGGGYYPEFSVTPVGSSCSGNAAVDPEFSVIPGNPCCPDCGCHNECGDNWNNGCGCGNGCHNRHIGHCGCNRGNCGCR